jgi:tetratricopeptide (TPR) repeat protein
VCREAVSVTPPGHPGYAMFRQGLGNALRARYDRSGDARDLRELVALDEQAIEATPPGDELRPRMLVNLASSLTRRYETEGVGGDSDRAEALLREASASLSDGHSLLAGIHYQLGLVLWTRHKNLGRPRDLDAAVACARTAALQQTGSPRIRLQSAVAWGRWAMTAGDPRQAAAGYGQAIELLPALTPRNLARGDAEDALTRFPGLACDAAACALQAGDAERAVTLLEQGRGVLLGQDLQGRDDVAELRDRAPDLAARFMELHAALDAGDASADTAGIGETAADVRHVLASDWDQLLARIRALPEFAHFLRPPPLAQLLEQAAHGPVALVNVSRHRCDALLLTSSGLRVVPLPQLTLEAAVQQAVGFHTVLEQLTDPASADPARRREHEDALGTSLSWLWDTVASPVLYALGIAGPPAPGTSWPRVWWIPTGPLAFLPVHAAGHHRAADGRSVLDRAVSSYAPTVRTLAHARRPAPRGTGRFLVVAVPKAPGASPLPGAAAEAAALAAMLPGARLLHGAEATRDAVVAGIQEHSWLHFCGHGSADPVSPSESQLIVHDYAEHPLTVTDISRLNLRTAELAYLSACTTARTGFGLADEALHLASGMQLAGYRHVVGTLWAIDDAMAVRIAERVYAALGAPRPAADLAAGAVHAAVREVRDQYPATPSLWAAHVHVGA